MTKHVADNRLPCPTCPWRRSIPKGGFPGGIIDALGLMRILRGGLEQPVMQCHCSRDDDPAVCVGFALQVGSDCVAYRFAVCTGAIDPDSLATDEPLHTLKSLLLTHGGRPA